MTTLTIINENIPKYQQLLNNVKPNTVIETIPNNINGVSLLNEIIQKYSNIDSLHIISHGTPGKINLGNSILGSEELNNYSFFSDIKNNFVSNGEILLYGCNVAAYQEGNEFINKLAEKTGLIITASTNVVGHHNLRGSWKLDFSTGNTNREVIITERGQLEWCDTLTHFRGGNLYWSDEGNDEIKLVITSYWRHDAHDEGLNVLFVPDVSDGNGVITNDDGSGTGSSTSVEIDEGNNHYTINTQTFMITYTDGNGDYVVTMSSGNRISTLQNGAADQSFGMETIVSPGSGNSSPKTSIPAILLVPINSPNWSYTIPANDPNGDSLTYSLPDTSLGGIYGTWNQIAGLDINVNNTGELTLDTTGFTTGDLYTVVVEISDGSTTIPVDFMIEFVDSIENPVISSNDLNECVYAGLKYKYSFTATIPSDPTKTLTWSELSVPVDNLSSDTSVENRLTMTFSPEKSQIDNVYIVNLAVTDNATGAITYLNVTFTVKKANIDDVVGIFNCAIKTIGVQCDKLNGLERILCLQEKKVEIWKNGQNQADELRNKLKKC